MVKVVFTTTFDWLGLKPLIVTVLSVRSKVSSVIVPAMPVE